MLSYIVNFFVKSLRGTFFLTFIILMIGKSSYNKIAKEENPEIKIPFVFVTVVCDGLFPQDGEKMILKPIEQELKAIEGIKKVTAYSYLGSAAMAIEFYAGLDVDKALRDVKDKVEIAKAKFPEKAKEPIVKEIDFSRFPVLNIIVKDNSADSKTDYRKNQVAQFVRDMQDEIESISEVLTATPAGLSDDLIEIVIKPMSLVQYNLTVEDLLRIATANKIVQSGVVKTLSGEFAIKVPGSIEQLEEFLEVPIKITEGDKVIKVKDFAEVRKTFKDPKYIARVNKNDAIVIEVSKRSGTNIINTIQKVRDKVNGFTKSSNIKNVEVIFSRDSSNNIKTSLSNLNNSIIFAVLSVVVVCVFMLNLTQGLLIAFTVPTTFLMTIITLKMMGYTLNIVVLFALILSIGIIVDGATIICEYAEKKIRDGLKPLDAYIMATNKMRMSVILSTLTIIIVLTPLLFWPGIVGEFMKYLPITVAITMFTSLISAFIILPAFGSIFGDYKFTKQSFYYQDIVNFCKKLSQKISIIGFIFNFINKYFIIKIKPLKLFFTGFSKNGSISKIKSFSVVDKTKKKDVFEITPDNIESMPLDDIKKMNNKVGFYARLLQKTLDRPLFFTALVITSMVVVIFLYSFFNKGVIFFPEIEPENAQVIVRARGNLSMKQKDEITKEVERIIIDKYSNEIDIFYTRVGSVDGGSASLPRDTIAVVDLEFADWQSRRPAKKIMEDIRRDTSKISGSVVQVAEQEKGPPSGKVFELNLYSTSQEAIDRTADKILEKIKLDTDFVDFEDSRSPSKIEYRININKELAGNYALNVETVGSFITLATDGFKVTEFRPDYSDKEIDVVFRFAAKNRSVDEVLSLQVPSKYGAIPLSNFATVTAGEELVEIYRIDGFKTITIKSDLKNKNKLDSKIKEITEFFYKEKLDNVNLVKLKFAGEAEDRKETGDFLANSFGVATLAVFLMLIFQLKSFYRSFVVLSAIFFSVIGVFLFLMLFQESFVIVMCGLGIVSLAGIVISNNLIFIETYEEYYHKFENKQEAIIKTAILRFNAILLTSLTTVIGIVPMMFCININFIPVPEISINSPSSQWWQHLSITISGGLIFATFLALFYTPALLQMELSLKSKTKTYFQRLKRFLIN